MTDPTPTPPPLDRISHNHGPEDGGGMACRTHPTGDCVIRALTARAEAAEAKIAAVRELAQRLREHPGGSGEHEAADAIDGALTGHWKTLGGTPTGDLADVCACGKSYWPCDSLDGTA